MAKFTDKQLVQLYAGLVSDYKAHLDAHYPKEEIEQILITKIENTLNPTGYTFGNEAQGGLSSLSLEEKNKVMNAAAAIITACHTNSKENEAAPANNNNRRRREPTVSGSHYCCHYSCCSRYHRPYTWVYIGGYNPGPRYPMGVSNASGFGGTSVNAPHNSGQMKAELAYIVIALSAFIAALLSAYYLYHEMANSAERFYYNEGWMQAALSYLSIAASAAVAGILSVTYATSPLLSLSIAAGFANPAGAAMFVLGALTVIGSALGCMAFNGLQDYLINSTSSDAIDPKDPARFALTESDISRWSKEKQDNLDPIKVKCAIVAIRAKMGEDIPVSTISSLFSKTAILSSKKTGLENIRKLRAGELDELKVGGMIFDFRKTKAPTLATQEDEKTVAWTYLAHAEILSSNNATAPILANATLVEPSAPPMK